MNKLLITLLALPIVMTACNRGDRYFVSEFQLSEVAQKDYFGAYQVSRPQKAFAASPGSSAYGVGSNQPSISDAQKLALEKCNQALRPGDLQCVVYDVNGGIVLPRTMYLRKVAGPQ